MQRKTFSQEMQDLKDEILLLSSMVEQAVISSVAALKDNDLEKARRIFEEDIFINRKRFENEYSILVLMATHQPTGHDLRRLAASLDICTELERMGDYAKGICVINLRSEGISLPKMAREIYSMAEKAIDMLHRTMTAFADEDVETAKAIISEDDVIDECYARLYNEAVHHILGEPRDIERANYVIWTAHNLERLADRVTNICERVIYIVTGERPELDTGHMESTITLPEHEW